MNQPDLNTIYTEKQKENNKIDNFLSYENNSLKL